MPNLSMTIRLAAINDADEVWRLVQDFAPTFRPEREAFEASRRAGDFYLALGYEEVATFYKKPLNSQ
jgi:hypothetical protein